MNAFAKKALASAAAFATAAALGLGAAGAALQTVGASAPLAPDAAWALGAEGFTAGGLEAPATLASQAVDYDITWYEGKASPYTISNLAQLKGLAYLVNNGTDDFEGKTVQLAPTANIAFLGDADAIDPIGTKDHPFQGTFDGNRGSASGKGIVAQVSEARIQNLMLKVGDRLEDIGLFGYAGDSAKIENLSVFGGEVVVSNDEDGKVIRNVGAIAGHLGGSMANCYSSTEVSVANDGAVPDKAGTKPDELCTILYVGGLVGSLGGDLADSVHAEGGLITLSSTSPVTDKVPYIAGYVGGLVGLQGDESADASAQILTQGCDNKGEISFNMTGTAKADRFGNKTYAKSAVVGGIAGYSMASFANCSNSAEINTGVSDSEGKAVIEESHGAVNTGGIVGSLRGPAISNPMSATGVVGSDPTDPGYDVWKNSNGATKPTQLSVVRCQNSARIIGLASVGGIVGNGGAFADILGCANTGQIDGTRSTKPCPAGIVGITNGNIGYCYNTGRVSTTTGAGYYASGIAGLLSTYNTSSTAVSQIMDAPEVYGCFVTGSIVSSTGGGYRSAVIAGESDGFIHDNCYISNLTADKSVPSDWQEALDLIGDDGAIEAEGVAKVQAVLDRVNALEAGTKGFTAFSVSGGKLVGGTKDQLKKYCTRCQIVEKDHNRGTLARNYELTTDELKGSLGLSYLNRPAGVMGDWSDSALFYRKGAGNAYPVLNWQDGGVFGAEDISGASVEVVEDPQYSAKGAPVPTLKVTLNGQVLYQNADYVVKVDPEATVTGKSYAVEIAGVNAYTGSCAPTGLKYTIQKCDISQCTVSATPSLFNWEKQGPKQVRLIDDNGTALPVASYADADANTEFVWKFPEAASADGSLDKVDATDTVEHSGKFYDYTHVHSASYRYDITVEVNNSVNYTGSTTQAAFHINWAQLTYGPQKAESENRDPTAIYDKVVYDGQEWDYLEAVKTKGYVKIKYTGSAIEPKINSLTYLGKPLRDGTGKKYWDAPLDYDFRYVYGNPNPDPTNVKTFDCVNVTGSAETDLACMAVRFTTGGDFDNYSNVFFEITPASLENDVQVSGADAVYAYTGAEIRPLTLTYRGMTLQEGRDFTAKYSNNVKNGQASAVLTGLGNYEGTVTAHFQIKDTAERASVIASGKVSADLVSYAASLGATSVTLQPSVKSIAANAFAGTPVKTIIVGTKKLKKSGVKNALKGSVVKTVKVQVMQPKPTKGLSGKKLKAAKKYNKKAKATNKKYVKKYKKLFTKKICGKKVKVK